MVRPFLDFDSDTKSFMWRLNDSLLHDEVCMPGIKKVIRDFCLAYSSNDTSPPMECEALKLILHGIFITHGSCLKKHIPKK